MQQFKSFRAFDYKSEIEAWKTFTSLPYHDLILGRPPVADSRDYMGFWKISSKKICAAIGSGFGGG
jgi:hypothetical protein